MTFEEPDDATPLDPDEMQGLKFPHVTTREQLDELEQANIEQGLAWISRRRGGSIFEDAFVRTLHKRLFGDVWAWAGEYRKTEKNIGIDPLHISDQLRTLLDDARYWAENEVFPPLEAAARFHHRRGTVTGFSCRAPKHQDVYSAIGDPAVLPTGRRIRTMENHTVTWRGIRVEITLSRRNSA